MDILCVLDSHYGSYEAIDGRRKIDLTQSMLEEQVDGPECLEAILLVGRHKTQFRLVVCAMYEPEAALRGVLD
jgi:hypothetical protein